jgi:serine/threonine-protein kinase RsbW
MSRRTRFTGRHRGAPTDRGTRAAAVRDPASNGGAAAAEREADVRGAVAPGPAVQVAGDPVGRLHLSAPALPDRVGALRLGVIALATANGAGEPAQADIGVAVSEALTNVVVHAYLDQAHPGIMRVEAYVDGGERLVVDVCDEGSWRGPRVDSPGAGLGLSLIAALAEDVEICGGGDGRGTRLRMRFDMAVTH